MEEVVSLRRDHCLQVGARNVHGDQGQVVVFVDRDVQLTALCQLGIGGRLGKRSPQLAQLDGLPDDLAVALGDEDRSLVAVVELGVEERRRLPSAAAPCGGIV